MGVLSALWSSGARGGADAGPGESGVYRAFTPAGLIVAGALGRRRTRRNAGSAVRRRPAGTVRGPLVLARAAMGRPQVDAGLPGHAGRSALDTQVPHMTGDVGAVHPHDRRVGAGYSYDGPHRGRHSPAGPLIGADDDFAAGPAKRRVTGSLGPADLGCERWLGVPVTRSCTAADRTDEQSRGLSGHACSRLFGRVRLATRSSGCLSWRRRDRSPSQAPLRGPRSLG
jgi:hypothetical protein